MKKKYSTIKLNPQTQKQSKSSALFLSLLLLLSINFGIAQTYNPPANSYTVPAGVTAIDVQAWGAGGAGGGSGTNNDAGAGGGGGAYTSKNTIAVTPGQIINFTIGTGGNGANNTNGSDGGNTTIPSLGLTANGGKGGPRNNGAGGLGGTATGGTINTVGQNGGIGGGNVGGDGGNSPNGGAGGLGRNNTNGDDGSTPGGGGGGGERGTVNRSGGDGGDGRIIFSYSLPTISGFTASGCLTPATTVTINGTNFTTATSVLFNGTSASFTVVSPTQITATVPSGATTGKITVTTAYGTIVTGSNFTVNTPPSISSDPVSISRCSGVSATFSVTATGVGISYQWYKNGAPIALANGATYTIASPSLIDAGTYNCVVSGTCTPSAISNNAILTITEKVTITGQPVATQSLCLGSAATFTTIASGAISAYEWYKVGNPIALADGGNISGATTFQLTLNPFLSGDEGSYYCMVRGTSPCGDIRSNDSVLILNTVPAISNPAPISLCTGVDASFSVTASGTGIIYKWYKDLSVISLADGGNISGSTTNTLLLTAITLADAGNYHCEVTGTCLPKAVSNDALLTVTEAISITSQPVTSQSFCTGNTAIFSVTASGAGPTYQWYNGATPLVDNATISGATTDTLTITTLAVSDAGTYHCEVTGISPCNPVNSNNSILVVNAGPGISSQPATTQTVCAGASVSFTITTTGGSPIYQWYKSGTLLLDAGNISGATTGTLTINPTSPGDSATDYYCTVSNGCVTPAISDNAALTVNEKPFIFSYAATICSRDSFSVSPITGLPTGATIVPTGTTYSWSAPIVTGGITGGSMQTNQAAISQTLINPTNTVQTATYTVTPISGTAGACVGASFTVTITVNPRPELNNLSLTTCSAETLTITPLNGVGNIVPIGTTYTWGAPIVTGGMTGGIAGSGTSMNFTLNNPTNVLQTANYTITATAGICVGSTFSVSVKVNPKPTVAGDITTQTICSGTSIAAITLSNPNGIAGTIDYSWTRDNTANLTGIAANGNGSVISGNLTNTTNAQQTTTFTLTATSDEGCISGPTPITIIVIVNPVPTVAALPLTQTICSGDNITPINITNPNNVSATVNYSWSWSGTGLSGIAASGTGSTITGALINSTNIQQTATFTVTAEKAGCSTSISTITVFVNPRPDIIATPNTTQTVCAETSFSTITVSNPNGIVGTTFSWTRSNTTNLTGYANSGSGTTIAAGSFINNTNSNQTTTFTINATSGSCATTTAATVDIIVKPSPLTTVSLASQTVCNLTAITPINFGTSNSMAGTTFGWSRDKTAELTGIAASGSGNITGTFTNTTTTTQTTTFTITATALNGCTHTSTATVTVYAPLKAPVIGADQTVCILSQPDVLTMTTIVSGGSPIYTYQWQSSTSGNPALPWTNLGVASTTATTYQPGFVNFGANNTYYRLIVTNSCGSVTSNTILIQVISSLGFTFDGVNDPATQCPGGSFSTSISSDHATSSSVRYSWTANPAYITPATGNNAGTTGPIQVFFFFIQYRESAANLPFTVQNNTNATVTTQISILPSVYDYPGPPGGAFQCSITPQIVNVTIRPRPVATATAPNLTICNATSAGIQVTGNITDANMTFSWTRNNTALVTGGNSGNSGTIAPAGTFTINNTLTNTTGVAQDVIYTITPSSNGCTGAAITITIKVAPLLIPGTITSSQTICNGDTPVAFSQTGAATAGATLQWQSSTDGISYSDISGATGNTYAPGALTQKTWFVRVASLITNGVTCSVVTTTPIIITINTVNSGSIATSQTICSGSAPAPLTSTGAGTGFGSISYEWEVSTVGCGSGWSPIGGAISATYAPGALTVTTYYRRKTKSLAGAVTCSAYSNCVMITVNTVNGGTVGSDQTLCGNNPAAFTELTPATGAGILSYQWQSNTTGCGGIWSPISGATAATYDAPAGVIVTTYYQRVTTSLLNTISCTAVSNCITVTPNPVTGGNISGNRTVCYGGDPTAFVEIAAATGTGLTYQWQMSTVSGSGPWTAISGATASTYDEPGPITQTTYYQRIAFGTVNSSSCSAPSSSFVTVFVNDVTASVVAGNQIVCGFEDPAAFTITTAATGNGILSYQWQSNTTGCGGAWANISGATSSTYDPPVLTQTTYYHVVVSSTLNSEVCTVTSNCLTITSNSMVWSGAINNDWENPSNWIPNGVPTSNNCVIIPNVTIDPIISGTNNEMFAYNLTVLNGGYLLVNATNTITVTDFVNVNPGGQFEIKDDASLVQVNNVNNSGIVKMERITLPVYRFDYTYWGSPMTLASNFKLGGVGGLSPLTQPDKYYSWIPSVSNSFGAWAYESAATVMDPTKGYIVRAPQTYSNNPSIKIPYTANFIGTPNNGDIFCPIMHGTIGPGNNNDKYNLLGNPYPSAVDAERFLSDPANVPVIDGTIYFWTHNSPPSTAYPDPFYGDFVVNYTETDYASWNRLGGAGTTAAATTGGATPAGFIAAGQGFFTRSTGTAPSGNAVVFKNSMRDKGNNGQFFRNGNTTPNTFEKHRIWLNLTNTNGAFNQILIGYAEGATEGWDRDFDGMRISETGIILYSIIPEGKLAIQGRPLPFNVEDKVVLGYQSNAQGTFSLRIDHVDGLFENQNIYVEDKLLNTIHDIKLSPYVFTTEIGTFNDRFVLRYTNTLLGVTNPNTATGVVALIDDEKLHIQSDQNIQRIYVYDITGKFIQSYVPDVQHKNFEGRFVFAEGIYMVKIKLQDGSVITQKLINRK